MTTQRLGVIMNGVTGRMGLNQHLVRSIIAIRESGGVVLGNGDRMMPDPILVGRDADKVEGLARQFNVQRSTRRCWSRAILFSSMPPPRRRARRC